MIPNQSESQGRRRWERPVAGRCRQAELLILCARIGFNP